MSTDLCVHLLPQLVDPAELVGRTVVVIDVLRATTTVCHALAAGATSVVPCLEIDEARTAAAKLGGIVMLGGERQGRRIEGFDLGNSPTEYTAASVGGRTVVFTTTNGTRTLRHAEQASEILLGGFVNLSAVVERLSRAAAISLLCAGTNGEITAEDSLFAGAVVDGLERRGRQLCALSNDEARLARDAWRTVAMSGRPLAAVLRECQGGRNLIAEGFDADIDTAAVVDHLTIVPRYDVASGGITSS
jgi:2-phosphosulfolactate phosphatase